MISQEAKETIDRYVTHGIRPGSFIQAVLENNLIESFARADEFSRANLYEIVKHLYNEVPCTVWGSKEVVELHLKRKQLTFEESCKVAAEILEKSPVPAECQDGIFNGTNSPRTEKAIENLLENQK